MRERPWAGVCYRPSLWKNTSKKGRSAIAWSQVCVRDLGQACATVPACGKTHQRKEEVLLHGVRCAYETMGRRVLQTAACEKAHDIAWGPISYVRIKGHA